MKPKWPSPGKCFTFVTHMDGVDVWSGTGRVDGVYRTYLIVRYGWDRDDWIGAAWFHDPTQHAYINRTDRIPESVKQWTRAYLALIQ